MCTVTLLPTGDGVRLAVNRDEQRHRPPAVPPRLRRLGDRLAAYPVDPASDGTWVGVNDTGLALVVLNVNPRDPRNPRPGTRASRGHLIPELLPLATLDEALARAGEIAPATFAPFRLVLVEARRYAVVTSDGIRLDAEGPSPLDRPVFFTSSGLGDYLVQGPRQRLFEEYLGAGADPDRQDALHRHAWPDNPAWSVCMSRADAATVSHTVLELGGDAATLTYHPDAPNRPAAGVTIRLALHPVGIL